MQVLTISSVAQVVGKSERRVRQVVRELSLGTVLAQRLIVLDAREVSRVKRHFAAIAKKRKDVA